jgi:Flp pilus assembly pilin Flp
MKKSRQALVEYALVLALIAIVAILVVKAAAKHRKMRGQLESASFLLKKRRAA